MSHLLKQQEKIFSVATADAADTVVGDITVVAPKATINLNAFAASVGTSGAAGSTVHIAEAATPTVPIQIENTDIEAATDGTASALAFAPQRGGVWRNESTSPVTLQVVVGATAPAQDLKVVVKYSPCSLPKS